MTERDDAMYGAAAGGGKFDPLWDDFLRVREQRDALLAACKVARAFIVHEFGECECDPNHGPDPCIQCLLLAELIAAVGTDRPTHTSSGQ